MKQDIDRIIQENDEDVFLIAVGLIYDCVRFLEGVLVVLFSVAVILAYYLTLPINLGIQEIKRMIRR